jgi:hypothetical protein
MPEELFERLYVSGAEGEVVGRERRTERMHVGIDAHVRLRA